MTKDCFKHVDMNFYGLIKTLFNTQC